MKHPPPIFLAEFFSTIFSDGTGDALFVTRKLFAKPTAGQAFWEAKRGIVKGIYNIMQTIETNPVIKGFLPPAEVALLFPPMVELNAAPPVRSSDWTPFSGEWDDTPAVRCTALDDF